MALVNDQALTLSVANCRFFFFFFLKCRRYFPDAKHNTRHRLTRLDATLMYNMSFSFPRKTFRPLLSYRGKRDAFVLQSRSDLLTINVGIVIANARAFLCISPTGTKLASYVIYVLSTGAGIAFRVNSLPKFHRISFDVFAEYFVQSHIETRNGRERSFSFSKLYDRVPREFSKYRSFLKNSTRALLYWFCVI